MHNSLNWWNVFSSTYLHPNEQWLDDTPSVVWKKKRQALACTKEILQETITRYGKRAKHLNVLACTLDIRDWQPARTCDWTLVEIQELWIIMIKLSILLKIWTGFAFLKCIWMAHKLIHRAAWWTSEPSYCTEWYELLCLVEVHHNLSLKWQSVYYWASPP